MCCGRVLAPTSPKCYCMECYVQYDYRALREQMRDFRTALGDRDGGDRWASPLDDALRGEKQQALLAGKRRLARRQL